MGQGRTQVTDDMRFLKKSLSKFEIGCYETRQAGQKKATYLPAVIRKGEDKGFKENQFPRGLVVI